MPNALDAERTTLGAMLLDPKVTAQTESLTPADFYLNSHQVIFRGMRELFQLSGQFDPITLAEWLAKRGGVEQVGGIGYITSLIDGVPHTPSVEQYVAIIVDHSRKRSLITAANLAVARLYDQDATDDVLGSLQADVSRVVSRNASKDVPLSETTRVMAERLFKQKRGQLDSAGLPTGVHGLDQALSGYRDGELTVIAAWPSHGKSALAVQGANANLLNGVAVGVISLEMSREALINRMVSMRAEINLAKFRKPQYMSDEQEREAQEQLAMIGQMPLQIDDTAGLTVTQLGLTVSLMVMRGAKIIFIDHLQRLGFEHGQEEKQVVSLGSRILADSAKKHRIPIVALSQLARPSGRTRNTRPNMFYLKESGDCEANADNIVLIYRPENEKGLPTGEDELIVDKQRDGAVGPISVWFRGEYARFEERARTQ